MLSYYQKTLSDMFMFMVMIVISMSSLSSGTNVCRKGVFPGSIVDHKLTQSTFLVYSSKGLVDCIRYCKYHLVCLSVNFNKVTNECELNGPAMGTLQNERYFLHLDVTNVPSSVSGLCGGHYCGVKERCQPNAESGYSCVLVGCTGSPQTANVNGPSFRKKALWLFGQMVEYACADGFYPSVNAVCQDNGTWSAFECNPFVTCDDLLRCGKPPNGEFWLEFFAGFRRVKMFCFLSLVKGYSFSTLTEPNYSQMAADIRVSNSSCVSQPQVTPYSNDLMGKTDFYKVYVYRPGRFIQIDQLTYTKSIGTKQNLATAGDCFSTNNLCDMKGSFVLDLRGTGLKIRNDVNWKVQGTLARMNISRSYDGLQVNGSCGGFCGGCLRENKIFFERDPTYVSPPLDAATMPTCQIRV